MHKAQVRDLIPGQGTRACIPQLTPGTHTKKKINKKNFLRERENKSLRYLSSGCNLLPYSLSFTKKEPSDQSESSDYPKSIKSSPSTNNVEGGTESSLPTRPSRAEVCKLQPLGQTHPDLCFCKAVLETAMSCSLLMGSVCSHATVTELSVTKTIGIAKLKTSTSQPFTENVCQPLKQLTWQDFLTILTIKNNFIVMQSASYNHICVCVQIYRYIQFHRTIITPYYVLYGLAWWWW